MNTQSLAQAIDIAKSLHRESGLHYVVWCVHEAPQVTLPEYMPIKATKHFETETSKLESENMNEAPPSPTTTRESVLLQAGYLVMGQRAADYGPPEQSMTAVAALWTVYLKARSNGLASPIDAHDAAMMMALLKVARAARRPGALDSYIDLAGYASIAAETRGIEMTQSPQPQPVVPPPTQPEPAVPQPRPAA